MTRKTMVSGVGMVLVMGAFLLGGWAQAETRGTRVEIQLENVFAPINGYDDNDNVEVVVHGKLPNGCYNLAETFVQPLDDGISYLVRQYAIKLTGGVCTEGSARPPYMEMMIPFSKTVSLGQLNAANYRLRYHAVGGEVKTRALSVMRAPVATMDTLPYANVTNADISDVFSGLDEVTFTMRGVLNSTCTELDEKVELTRENDVYVVLPVIKVKPDVVCAQVLVPFTKTIQLGRMVPGEYLLHVRAMNGASVNRVFTVTR